MCCTVDKQYAYSRPVYNTQEYHTECHKLRYQAGTISSSSRSIATSRIDCYNVTTMYLKRLGKHLWLWHHQSSYLSLMELLKLIHTSTSNPKSSAILLEDDTLEISYHHVMVFCSPEDTLHFSWSGIIQNYMSDYRGGQVFEPVVKAHGF